ncbi:metallophosphoesterase [Chitinophaga lutea]
MDKSTQPTSRRGFLGKLTKAGLLGAAAVSPVARAAAAVAEPAPAPAAFAFQCPPYLQHPTPNSMTVMWLSNNPSYSWVEYGETDQLGQKAFHVENGIADSYNTLHKVVLTGLKPGTTYYYTVKSKEITDFQPYKLTYGETIGSEVYSFKTPAEKPDTVSWVVLNDIHDRPASIPHLISLNKDFFDFVFLNGDMFDYQQDEKQIIDHLLLPAGQSFASRAPFIFTRGNHETRGKYRRELGNYFHGDYYWAKAWGPVHFTVLDTGEDKPDDHPVYAGIVDFDNYRTQQAEWFKTVVKTPEFKKAKFRVVMMHIPHYYSGDWHGPMHCRELFGPLFEEHKIDLFIAGHTHRYGIHQPVAGQHSYPIVIGGGPKEGNRTLIKVRATDKQLDLVMLKDDGSHAGKVELKSRR